MKHLPHQGVRYRVLAPHSGFVHPIDIDRDRQADPQDHPRVAQPPRRGREAREAERLAELDDDVLERDGEAVQEEVYERACACGSGVGEVAEGVQEARNGKCDVDLDLRGEKRPAGDAEGVDCDGAELLEVLERDGTVRQSGNQLSAERDGLTRRRNWCHARLTAEISNVDMRRRNESSPPQTSNGVRVLPAPKHVGPVLRLTRVRGDRHNRREHVVHFQGGVCHKEPVDHTPRLLEVADDA